MVKLLEPAGMAKKRGRPAKSERNDKTAKIDAGVLGMARAVATQRGIPLAELLTELLRGPVGREYAKMLRELDSAEGKS